MDDIREACRYAKEHGANIHVTVNIIPHNEDFEGLEQYLKDLEEAGVTAIITASVYIMALAKKVAPKTGSTLQHPDVRHQLHDRQNDGGREQR